MIIKIDCPYQCSNTFPVLLAFGYEYLRWPGGICNTAAIVQSLSFVRLFATPWTVAHQAPLSTGLPRQEHWSGLPFPPPGDLPDLGIEPASPALAGICFTTESPGKPLWYFRGLLMLHSGGNRGKRLGFRDRRLGLHPALPRIRFKSLFLTLGEVT